MVAQYVKSRFYEEGSLTTKFLNFKQLQKSIEVPVLDANQQARPKEIAFPGYFVLGPQITTSPPPVSNAVWVQLSNSIYFTRWENSPKFNNYNSELWTNGSDVYNPLTNPGGLNPTDQSTMITLSLFHGIGAQGAVNINGYSIRYVFMSHQVAGKPAGNIWSNYLIYYTDYITLSNKDDIFSITDEKLYPDNPYEPGGPSGPTDPDLPPGTFDDSSDPIPDSPLPTISAADTGFTRIYNPTLAQVQALAQYLWTTPDIIETIWNHIKQFFENPMDAIIGFNLVPVPVPDGGTTNFKLMYIDTGVAMTAAANQFVDVDCGTLEVKRYYGSALDQSPYTKVSCFLPYIGTVQLNTDEVMGATLQVKYRVDICSGSCVAKIFIDGNCIYQYSGHCAINIPISSADFSSYVSAAINVAKLAIGAATAGAGGAAMAAAQVAGTEQQTGNMTAFHPQGGSSPNLPAIYQGQSQQPPPSQTTTSASFAGLSPANVSNTVGEIMNAKPHVEHSGSFSGNTGYLGVRRPFVIIERPNMCMPENYQALNGFPAMITMELSSCKGFTRVQQVQLTGMTATNPEQAEILELLKSGVIL